MPKTAPRVAVITDSECSLPTDLVREYGITLVPITCTIDGRSYRDLVDITAADFWKQYPTMKRFSTGTPAPGQFMEAFLEAGKKTKNIACTFLSRVMSGTHNSAQRAREMVIAEHPEFNIEIVDSMSSIGAVGFIALEAARAATAGKALPEVVAVMEDMVKRAKWVNGLDSAARVARNGRVPETVSKLGYIPEWQLIAQLHCTGKVEDVGKVEGKERLFERIVELIGENTDSGKPLHVTVNYMDRIEDGRTLLKMIKAKYDCAEANFAQYAPSIAGMAGPSTGCAFFT